MDTPKNLSHIDKRDILWRKMAELTLSEHAEAWWIEQGKDVPERGTEGWNEMYVAWVYFAFGDFPDVEEK